jgi:hypothetical protein
MPLAAAPTLAPFLAGWLAAAVLVGVYGGEEPRRSWRAVAWLAGANLGPIARGSPLLPGGTTWPFPLVTTGTTLGALLLWRGTLVALARLRRPMRTPAGD